MEGNLPSADEFHKKTAHTAPGYAFSGCCDNTTGTTSMRNHVLDMAVACQFNEDIPHHVVPKGIDPTTRKQKAQAKAMVKARLQGPCRR